ncbi:MAG: 6-phospho-3-hexuloisomerase [Phycisphaerales bacterium]|nr:6-phospho-3-hexuloisomerase [Phycisphaerales bacterium]
MKTTEYAAEVVKELGWTLSHIPASDAEQLAEKIISANKILVAGAGRSGLAMKAFAMRLAHMGLEAYVVGETITPNFAQGDLLLIGSGSGETGSLISMAEKAKKIGGNIALITILLESSIGQLANITVKIPAPTPKATGAESWTSIQPMGSLFEQSLLIFLDIVILKLMEEMTNDSANMFKRHANLE